MAKVVFRDAQGREIGRPKGGITRPTDESVEIDLGDGKSRELRYPISSLKLMRDLGILHRRDDSDLPTLIWVGLHSEDGNPPDGVTAAQIAGLGAHWLPYLGAAFVAAFTQAMPPEPAQTEEKKVLTMEKAS